MTRALVIQEREMDGLLTALEEGEYGMARSLVKAMIQLCPIVDRAVAVAAPEMLRLASIAESWIALGDGVSGFDRLEVQTMLHEAIAKVKGGKA